MYTAGVVLMVPAMVMAMAAGAVFGVAMVWNGALLGQRSVESRLNLDALPVLLRSSEPACCLKWGVQS